MKKKIAVIIEGFFWEPDNKGTIRGAGFYINNFITSLVLNNDVDVYCIKSSAEKYPYIKNIFHYTEEYPITKEALEEKEYDFVWNLTKNLYFRSDKFLTFDIQHSHSRIYRHKFVRRPYELFFKRIFNPSRYFTPQKMEEYKKIFKRVDILFANSKNAQNDYVNLCEIDISEVPLLNPIIQIPDEKDIKKSGNEFFTFGMSAVTFDLKGGYIFLEALSRLKKKNKNFRAKVIYPHYKKNLILQLFVKFWGLEKYVSFLDYQSSMKDFYNSVDCIVMPSREETFGFVAAEGMTYKRPVIVSDVAGASDIIENGKNGFIFELKNNPARNLAKIMSEVITDKNLEQIAEEGFKTAQNNTLKYHSEKLNKILDDILIKKGKRQ